MHIIYCISYLFEERCLTLLGSQSSVVGAASSWAGWAYSSLTSKLNKNPTTSNPVPNEGLYLLYNILVY